MTFGILEPSSNSCPSGTSNIQSNRGSGAELVLVPSPSDSPADPLNWSRLCKELLFATVILGSCATGSLGPLLVPDFTNLAAYLDVPLTKVTLLNGSLVMALGISSYLCVCCAQGYGKRPVYLFTTILLAVSCCWAAVSKSYESLVAARTFQGLGMGGFFALAGTSTINDVFFVHERGLRVGLWNFGVIISVNMAPIISGYVISGLSWRWAFWLEVIFFGILLTAVIFFFPETTFDRNEEIASPPSAIEGSEKVDGTVQVTACSTTRSGSYWRSTMEIYPVTWQSHKCVLSACWSAIPLFLHPIVVWGCVMWAVTFTWTILLGAVASQIFTVYPFDMTTSAVGNLTGIGPFIGSALGTLTGGWLCDFSARTMAVRNKGVFEPEFRLPPMIIAFMTMAIGSFSLGAVIERGFSPIVCGIFMAFLNYAVGMGCTIIVSYTNDVCMHKAGDAFALAMVIKSSFAFGLSFVFNDYEAAIGALSFFSTFGALTCGVMLTTIPVYIFGKRIRAWADRMNLLNLG